MGLFFNWTYLRGNFALQTFKGKQNKMKIFEAKKLEKRINKLKEWQDNLFVGKDKEQRDRYKEIHGSLLKELEEELKKLKENNINSFKDRDNYN